MSVRRRAAAQSPREGAEAGARESSGRTSSARYEQFEGMPRAPTSSSSAHSTLSRRRAADPSSTCQVEPLDFGGERYEVTPTLVPVVLDVSRTTGNGYALRLRFEAGCADRACAAWSPPTRRRGRRARGRPARRRRGARVALRLRGGELDLAAWARDALALVRCRRRSSAGPDCAGSVPACGAQPQRRPDPTIGTSGSRTRAGRSCPRSELRASRLSAPAAGRRLASLAAHGRPQAEAVPLAHEQAPLAAQDHGAVVNACPQCPSRAARTGCARTAVLRRPRGR